MTSPTSSPAPVTATVGTDVPWWAIASAATAPVAMIGGWTLAAAMQPEFDSVSGTISALAAAPAAAPAVMTTGLAVTGLCHMVTALGLRSVPRVGRLLLAAGGIGTAAVAALRSPPGRRPTAPLPAWPS